MKIASNSLLMDSSHISQQHYERQESLRLWVGTQRPSTGGNDAVPATRGLPVSEVQISQAGALAQSDETDAIAAGLRAAENDPMLQLLRAMIAILTGEEVRIFDAGDLASDTPPVDVLVETQAANNRPAMASNTIATSPTERANRRALRQAARFAPATARKSVSICR